MPSWSLMSFHRRPFSSHLYGMPHFLGDEAGRSEIAHESDNDPRRPEIELRLRYSY